MIRMHIDKDTIAMNARNPGIPPLPPIRIRRDGQPLAQRAHAVEIHGPSRIVYHPAAPFHGTTTCWIETDSPITVTEESNATPTPAA
jgi:hypothetical protein